MRALAIAPAHTPSLAHRFGQAKGPPPSRIRREMDTRTLARRRKVARRRISQALFAEARQPDGSGPFFFHPSPQRPALPLCRHRAAVDGSLKNCCSGAPENWIGRPCNRNGWQPARRRLAVRFRVCLCTTPGALACAGLAGCAGSDRPVQRRACMAPAIARART